MDQYRFTEICNGWFASERERLGIGTQSEKTLHAILKRYFEPNETKHEIKMCGYIADIADDGEIIEIQTKELYRLAPKISAFLAENRVTVVYPIIVKKQLFWLDTETGECKFLRKSSKCGKSIDLLYELYGLREFLGNPNFRVCVVLLEANEYRALDGYGKDKKKHATKLDRIPTALMNEFYLEKPMDYRRFFPEALPPVFTSADFRTAANCSLRTSQRALNIFTKLGLIKVVGKTNRFNKYEMVSAFI